MTRTELRLSLQRALLGKVVPGLWGVGFRADGEQVVVQFYFDDPSSPASEEVAADVMTEVIADARPDALTRDAISHRPAREDEIDVWVFRRADEASGTRE